MRTERTNEGVLSVTYSRDLAGERQDALALLREACTAKVLERAPEHDQRNAALGLLADADAASLTAWIAACRSAYADAKAAILAAPTCDAVYAVVPDWPT